MFFGDTTRTRTFYRNAKLRPKRHHKQWDANGSRSPLSGSDFPLSPVPSSPKAPTLSGPFSPVPNDQYLGEANPKDAVVTSDGLARSSSRWYTGCIATLGDVAVGSLSDSLLDVEMVISGGVLWNEMAGAELLFNYWVLVMSGGGLVSWASSTGTVG
ncbi:hypothetical protein Nepgr_013547 [Nepenthes gracilis]|uniref:Uncharacterized protein n=1 Tax=Nepenthes gracilis TaxID=150966 RepID=A0AAD3SJB0_NEPGR|nr:hypothetical protein Nepgr_013547 [Nepenthes gracilis]